MISEFSVTERISASMNMTAGTGEAFGGPVSIGYYPGQPEVFIDHEGHRLNIPAEWMKPFIKQLQRAGKIAADQAEDPAA